MVSEDLASCILENVAVSEIGAIHLNSEKLNKFFGKTNLHMDTSFLAQALNIDTFQNKLGTGQPLEAVLKMKNPKLSFGKGGTDIVLSFVFSFDVYQILSGG